MTPEEQAQVEAVAGYLESLRAVADQAGASERDVRRVCALLVRLLLDGAYAAAWRAAGFEQEPRIPAVDLLHHIAEKDRSHVAWAQAAGGLHEGHRVVPLIIHDRPLSALEIRASYQRSGMEPLVRYLPVGAYLAGTCVVHKDLELDRARLIRYAGARVGAPGSPGEGDPDGAVPAIEHALGVLKVTDPQAPFYEVLSMALDVGHCRVAARLRSRAAGLGIG
ncbi:MAG: hypothetical protein ACRDJO_09390, partial [Actinomycetota bacterium]